MARLLLQRPCERGNGSVPGKLRNGLLQQASHIGRGATVVEQEKDFGPLGRQYRRGGPGNGRMVAADPAMLAVIAEAEAVAPTDACLLIEGPSGAGKDVLARHVHRLSARADGPFVAINCAALPETMAEALLFGHERGAFTGAAGAAEGLFRAADGGTLFLDELGELSPATQARLLRALQERAVLPLGASRPVPFDARIIAATNRSLLADVASGRFRADLYWRLAVFPLTVPALAARPADILPLAAVLLGDDVPAPTEAALAKLLAHDWPGNVRELGNVLQRAAILARGRVIDAADIRIQGDPPPLRLAAVREAGEAEAIRTALAGHGGQRRAAEALGISERTLRYKLAALNGRPRRAATMAREVMQ